MKSPYRLGSLQPLGGVTSQLKPILTLAPQKRNHVLWSTAGHEANRVKFRAKRARVLALGRATGALADEGRRVA